MIRLTLGFISAALWLPLLLIIISGKYGEFWFGVVSFLTVPLTVFVAVPLYIALHKKIRIGLVACITIGFTIGFIGVLLFFFMTHYQAAINWAPSLIVIGTLSGFIFWLVGIYRNEKINNA